MLRCFRDLEMETGELLWPSELQKALWWKNLGTKKKKYIGHIWTIYSSVWHSRKHSSVTEYEYVEYVVLNLLPTELQHLQTPKRSSPKKILGEEIEEIIHSKHQKSGESLGYIINQWTAFLSWAGSSYQIYQLLLISLSFIKIVSFNITYRHERDDLGSEDPALLDFLAPGQFQLKCRLTGTWSLTTSANV
jgi:hypothetical protein